MINKERPVMPVLSKQRCQLFTIFKPHHGLGRSASGDQCRSQSTPRRPLCHSTIQKVARQAMHL